MPHTPADSITTVAGAGATASADTVNVQAPREETSWAPVPFAASTELMAPYSAADRALYHTSAPGWLSGINAPVRRENLADNPGVLSLLIGLFVLIGLNMNSVRHLFRSLPQKLWSVRRRENAFDETTTNETRTFALLLIMLFVAQGILLFKWIDTTAPGGHVFGAVSALIGLAGAYYLFQYCAYAVVGYVFTDHSGAASWLRGFKASAAILGVALVLPALIALFYPSVSTAMLIVGGILFVMAKLTFMAKGFRIFYNNFLSLLYFILYLCTLEIIPVIVLYISATEICKNI